MVACRASLGSRAVLDVVELTPLRAKNDGRHGRQRLAGRLRCVESQFEVGNQLPEGRDVGDGSGSVKAKG